MVKCINHPDTGRIVTLGRNRPSREQLDRPRLKFADYLGIIAPPVPPPGPYGRTALIPQVISRLYGNDSVGDCTVAAEGHLVGAFTGEANPPAVVFTDADVLAAYYRLTGGPDTGLDEITVLDDWKVTGGISPDHKIVGYVSVDATNQAHVQLALWMFANAYACLELPDAYVGPFPSASGFTWDVAGSSVPDNGHAIAFYDCDATGVYVMTWGMWGKMTWSAVIEYLAEANGGSLNVVLTQDLINKASQKTAAGFDFSTLQDDILMVG
jgi:hypothetical protein